MEFTEIKSKRDINQVMHNGEVLWGKVIHLNPSIGEGDRSNRILIDVDLPIYKKRFTKIRIDYDQFCYMGGTDLEFTLSDYRFFGWKPNSIGYPSSYGSPDGVTGSPLTEIEIHSLDDPISNIKINVIFNRSITEGDIRNLRITAEYVLEG